MQIIKYQMAEVNHGTEKEPHIEQTFFAVSIPWSESNEALAAREAYNGEYTIEDDGKPEPEPAPLKKLQLAVAELAAEVDTSNAALYSAQQTVSGFVYADQYKKWDGLKWVFDPENPIPLLRFPFPVEPNAIYRLEDGRRMVGAKAGSVSEETMDEYLTEY